MAKLLVTLEISIGEGKPDDYKGIMDLILEESRHWGDYDCKVLHETIVEEDGTTYPIDFFDKD